MLRDVFFFYCQSQMIAPGPLLISMPFEVHARELETAPIWLLNTDGLVSYSMLSGL